MTTWQAEVNEREYTSRGGERAGLLKQQEMRRLVAGEVIAQVCTGGKLFVPKPNQTSNTVLSQHKIEY